MHSDTGGIIAHTGFIGGKGKNNLAYKYIYIILNYRIFKNSKMTVLYLRTHIGHSYFFIFPNKCGR